jgi:hypothetical protein
MKEKEPENAEAVIKDIRLETACLVGGLTCPPGQTIKFGFSCQNSLKISAFSQQVSSPFFELG